MKNIKYLIGVVIVLVVVVVLLKSDSKNRNKGNKQAAASAKKFQHIPQVQELCSKYNAITNWKQQLGKNGFYGHTFTIEVEDALIRTEGRPILFYGTVNDIVRESDKYLVYFGFGFAAILRDTYYLLNEKVFFVLDCTQEQVEQITNNPAGIYDEYAVIAQISQVEKVRFELKSNAMSDEDVSVDLEPSDVFMAKGKCLDLLFISGKKKDDQKE